MNSGIGGARRLGACAATFAFAFGCSEQGTQESATAVHERIINGTAATATDVNQAFVRASVNCMVGQPRIKVGSAAFLTNDWLLTAAHVVDGVADTCSNGAATANAIEIQFKVGTNTVIVNGTAKISPDYKPGQKSDVALIHLDMPVTLNGSTTGYSRNITTLNTKELLGKSTRCFGYGRSSITQTGQKGILLSGNFLIGKSPDKPSQAFAVFKGGGSTASNTGNGQILYEGDSGGGCVDPNGGSTADIFGVATDTQRKPSCNSNSDCLNAGMCNVSTHTCSNNDPNFSDVLAPGVFRDFARAALGPAAPPVKLGAAGSSVFSVAVHSVLGFFVMDFVGSFGTAQFPTFIPDPGNAGGPGQVFASASVGDFNNDGLPDILGLIAGTSFYFSSGAGAFNPANPFNSTVPISGTEGFVFDRVADINGDHFDDAELVRGDGSSTILYGSPTGLGVASAPPSLGPDFDGDGLEDIAVSAIGDTVAGGTSGITAGSVHFMYGNRTGNSLFGDNVAGPPSKGRDAFGLELAWGNFDDDEADELLILRYGAGFQYVDQGTALYIPTASIVDGPTTVAFGAGLTAGDFDGDGFDDVAFNPGNDQQLEILFGGVGGLSSNSRRKSYTSAQVGNCFPDTSADLNGDGRDDLVLGCSGADAETIKIIPGADGSPSLTDAYLVTPASANTSPAPAPGDLFGANAIAGDFNGDGFADIAVAATTMSASIANAGATYVFYGSAQGATGVGAQLLKPCCGTPFFPTGASGFGSAMSVSHLNSDGFDDLLIGWGGFSDTATSQGQVFTYAGGKTGLDVAGGQHWGQPGQGSNFGSFGQAIGGTSTGTVAVGAPFLGPNSPLGELTLMNPTGLGFNSNAYGQLRPANFPDNPAGSSSGTSQLGFRITSPRPRSRRASTQVRARTGLTAFISGSESAAPSFTSFEDPERAWTSTAPLLLNYAQKALGQASLQVNASNNVSIDSPSFRTTEWSSVGTKLAVDVFIPTTQPNPSWLGDVQVTFSAAAVNISNASLGVVALTGLPRGAWSTLEFTVPATVRAALLGDLPRASFSLIMNTPNGAQPLLLDNLRFSGTQTARTVFHQVAKADGVSSNALFSFETLSDWSSPQGGLSLASQNVLQGTSALSIPALGYSQIRSRNFATSELSGVTSKLSLGVFVPSNQPNLSSVGSVQAYFSCPSAGINSLYLGQASLANTFFGEYNQLTFSLPANVVSALNVSHTDFQITLALNVTASSSQYLFDDLGFVAP